LCGEGAGHMVANESGGACEKNLHRKNAANPQFICSEQAADRVGPQRQRTSGVSPFASMTGARPSSILPGAVLAL
jgi:hypothetical protein